MGDDRSQGISIERMKISKSDFMTADYEGAKDSHRDEGYTFHIVEAGTVLIEIDFKEYEVVAPAVVFMHPNQVHRILEFEEVIVGSLSIKGEVLSPDHINLLEDLVPSEPLFLSSDVDLKVSAIFSLCLDFAEKDNSTFYSPVLKDCCNTLVAYLISQFLLRQRQGFTLSRFDLISKSFQKLLDKQFRTLKRPADFAGQLYISVSYLNECVHHTTGLSVSKNIHNRIILEAKRMLYHSNKSIKEIAAELGYDDYSYFSKLFNKSEGMSALAFRNKNRD
jgi:AraC family transcriptional activator of pobA